MHARVQTQERSTEERVVSDLRVGHGHPPVTDLILFDAPNDAAEPPDLYARCIEVLDGPTRLVW